MSASLRLRAVLPLAISIAVMAFLWTEFALNLSFHWLTVKDGVFGKFGLPRSFMLVVPAAFVSWGWFFALGGDTAALRKTLISAATGTLAAVLIMVLGPALADSPDFWGLAVAVGIAALALGPVVGVVVGQRVCPCATVHLRRRGPSLVVCNRSGRLRAGRQGSPHRRRAHRSTHYQAAGGRHRCLRRPAVDSLDLGCDRCLCFLRLWRAARRHLEPPGSHVGASCTGGLCCLRIVAA